MSTSFADSGSGSSLFVGQSERTDGGVRADIMRSWLHWMQFAASQFGNGNGNAALLVSGSALLERCRRHDRIERGNGQGVAVHLVDRDQDVLDHLDELRGWPSSSCVSASSSASAQSAGTSTLTICGSAGVDGLVVHLDDVLALLGVGLGGRVLHVLDGACLDGMTLASAKNADCRMVLVRLPMPISMREVDGVDGVKLNVVLCNVALRRSGVRWWSSSSGVHWQLMRNTPPGLTSLHDREALGDVGRVVAGDEVSLVDVVRALDRLVAEAQVARWSRRRSSWSRTGSRPVRTCRCGRR